MNIVDFSETIAASDLKVGRSRHLISSQGELIGYSWSGVRPSASSFTMLKDLLLQNCFANQSQILCLASLGRGN